MTINLTDDNVCISWTLNESTQDKCKKIIYKLWDQYKIQESLAEDLNKDKLRINICATGQSDDQPEINSYACGYSYGNKQYMMYLYISEHFFDAPDDILETAIRKAWLGEHLLLTSNDDGPKPLSYTDYDEVQDEMKLSEYLSTDEYLKNHKENSLRHEKQFVTKLKSSLRQPLEFYVQTAIDMKLITKEETEGIDYRWYKGKSGLRILDHSVRTLKLVAIDSEYATTEDVPSYVMIYAIYLGTKLMNQPIITSEKFLDSANLMKILNNGYPLSDLALKWLGSNCQHRTVNLAEILRK